MEELEYNKKVEKWGIFQVKVNGFKDGNPFTDYVIRGIFRGKNENVKVEGFYDGDGIYIVRFMPSFEGKYIFEISGNAVKEKKTGSC